MRIGFVQFEPVFGEVKRNCATLEKLIGGHQCDLLVLPELANSGYLFSSADELEELSETIPNGPFCEFLRNLASRGTTIVSGICERDGGKYYNSAILVSPPGPIHIYRKIHLYDTEKRWFAPGDRSLQVHGINLPSGEQVRLGMMICFDWRFPEVARTLALRGAQILCHPSNLVMPFAQDAMKTRALENRVFTITANRIGRDVKPEGSLAFTGRSIMVDPSGRVLAEAAQAEAAIMMVDINPADALDKQVTSQNDLFADRRPGFYDL